MLWEHELRGEPRGHSRGLRGQRPPVHRLRRGRVVGHGRRSGVAQRVPPQAGEDRSAGLPRVCAAERTPSRDRERHGRPARTTMTHAAFVAALLIAAAACPPQAPAQRRRRRRRRSSARPMRSNASPGARARWSATTGSRSGSSPCPDGRPHVPRGGRARRRRRGRLRRRLQHPAGEPAASEAARSQPHGRRDRRGPRPDGPHAAADVPRRQARRRAGIARGSCSSSRRRWASTRSSCRPTRRSRAWTRLADEFGVNVAVLADSTRPVRAIEGARGPRQAARRRHRHGLWAQEGVSPRDGLAAVNDRLRYLNLRDRSARGPDARNVRSAKARATWASSFTS